MRRRGHGRPPRLLLATTLPGHGFGLLRDVHDARRPDFADPGEHDGVADPDTLQPDFISDGFGVTDRLVEHDDTREARRADVRSLSRARDRRQWRGVLGRAGPRGGRSPEREASRYAAGASVRYRERKRARLHPRAAVDDGQDAFVIPGGSLPLQVNVIVSDCPGRNRFSGPAAFATSRFRR